MTLEEADSVLSDLLVAKEKKRADIKVARIQRDKLLIAKRTEDASKSSGIDAVAKQ